MHVDEKHGSIGGRLGSERSEVDVLGPYELAARRCVTQYGHSVLAIDLGPADQTPNRFGNEKIAIHFLWQAVSTINTLSGTSGEYIETSACSNPSWSTLYIGHRGNGKNRAEIGFGLTTHVEHPIGRGLLKEKGGVFAATSRIVKASVVILREPPLSTSSGKFLCFQFSVNETVADILVSKINPIVEGPYQTTRLVFHVSSSFSSLEDLFFLIGNAVSVRVPIVP